MISRRRRAGGRFQLTVRVGAGAEPFPSLSGSSTASVALSVSVRRVMSRAASRSTILSTDPVITARSSRASCSG